MDADNLVRMANRIAEFFDSVPDPQEAIEGVAQHMCRFWAPTMRSQLAAHVDQGHAAELHPLVAAALARQHDDAGLA